MEGIREKIVTKDGVRHVFVQDGNGTYKCVPASQLDSKSSTDVKRPVAGRVRTNSCPSLNTKEPEAKRVRRISCSQAQADVPPMDEEDDELDDDEEEEDDDDEEDEEMEAVKGSKTPDPKEAVPKKSRRVTWKVPEVEKFLELCYDKHVVEKRDGQMGQNLNTKQIFEPVARALNESRLNSLQKTAQDCAAKFSRLRKVYRRAMRQNNTSGHNRANIKYFDALHKLLHKRPNVNALQYGFQSALKNSSSSDSPVSPGTTSPEETVDDKGTEGSSLKPKSAPKYRNLGGRASSSTRIDAWRQQDFEDQERQRKFDAEQAEVHQKWMAQLTAEQQQRDEKLVLTMSETMSQSLGQVVAQAFASFGQLLSQPQPQPTASHPSMFTPSQSSSTQIQEITPLAPATPPRMPVVSVPPLTPPRPQVMRLPQVSTPSRPQVTVFRATPAQAQPRPPIQHVRLIRLPAKSLPK